MSLFDLLETQSSELWHRNWMTTKYWVCGNRGGKRSTIDWYQLCFVRKVNSYLQLYVLCPCACTHCRVTPLKIFIFILPKECKLHPSCFFETINYIWPKLIITYLDHIMFISEHHCFPGYKVVSYSWELQKNYRVVDITYLVCHGGKFVLRKVRIKNCYKYVEAHKDGPVRPYL